MPSLLILTVGTGTAGAHSDVSAGLARTINLTQPRLYWLVPSQSEKSLPVADMIRDQIAGGPQFVPWNTQDRYRAIPDPDDIHCCRKVLREVIRAARQQLRPGERLVINPTGGTKQMSAGATLAALDEEVGELMFTTGERQDGVVKTGTEQTRSLSTEAFFFERDLRIAESLFECGSFFAAARVLKHYPTPEALRPRETALCLHEWQRLNYAKAASHAAKFSEPTLQHLRELEQADDFSTKRLGDLLAGADELLRWGDCEEALARYYRSAEQLAKVCLAEHCNLRPSPNNPDKYRLQDLEELSPRMASDLRSRAQSAAVFLHRDTAWKLLESINNPLGEAYARDTQLAFGLSRRNRSLYGHGAEPVDANKVQSVAACLRNLLAAHLPDALASWTVEPRPKTLRPGCNLESQI